MGLVHFPHSPRWTSIVTWVQMMEKLEAAGVERVVASETGPPQQVPSGAGGSSNAWQAGPSGAAAIAAVSGAAPQHKQRR